MYSPLSVIIIVISSLVNISILGSQEQSPMSRMLMGDKTRSSHVSSLCLACRHSCCFFTNCSVTECPVCHVKVPLCHNNCPCNIFTSDEEVVAPWEGKEEKEESPGKQCGPPDCGIVCGTGEFCANTGAAELCDSVKCIKFDV